VREQITKPLFESPRQFPDQYEDTPTELVQSQKYGIPFSDLGLIENYLRKECCILIDFYSSSIRRELVALFQCQRESGDTQPSTDLQAR
jgi:hypothetical protein